MAIIKCTAKLQKEFGMKSADTPDQLTDLCHWHANLLRLDRKKYVLFTNDQTLYSFIIRWTKTLQLSGFKERFKLGLFKNLVSENVIEEQLENVNKCLKRQNEKLEQQDKKMTQSLWWSFAATVGVPIFLVGLTGFGGVKMGNNPAIAANYWLVVAFVGVIAISTGMFMVVKVSQRNSRIGKKK